MVIRLLIVLADTEGSDLNNAAVLLHRGLHGEGLEVRTIALAPGPHGGLDAVVPVLAPTPRSLASVMQLRREQRWADAVVCAGPTAMFVQRMSGSRKERPVFQLDPDPGIDPDAGRVQPKWLAARFAALGARGGSNAPRGTEPGTWKAHLEAAVEPGSADGAVAQ